MSAELAALRAYVTDENGRRGLNQSASTVRLNVEHASLKARFVELRLDKHMTIASLKQKLATHTGTSAEDMALTLTNAGAGAGAGAAAGPIPLTDPARPLGFYSPADGGVLRVTDTNPHSLAATGWLEDTSKVEKYVMSDAAYAEREGTYRAYKEERRKIDPTWTAARELAARRGAPLPPPPAAAAAAPTEEEAAAAVAAAVAAFPLGARCEVAPGAKRGCVRFVGAIPTLPPGPWVGVQYDEPVGKNDGTPPVAAKGGGGGGGGGAAAAPARLFECEAGYGGFVRPAAVVVGDFPPVEVDFGSEDEI